MTKYSLKRLRRHVEWLEALSLRLGLRIYALVHLLTYLFTYRE